MSSKNLFDVLNDLTLTKCEFSEEVSYTQYMINRFISMSPVYLPLVNIVNKQNIPNQEHYNYFKTILPKRKTYFKYIKKPAESLDEDLLIMLCTHFKIGRKDAENYVRFIPKDVLESLSEDYKPKALPVRSNKGKSLSVQSTKR